ncbi:Rlp7 protein [Saccharomycopsis crataegensis]|uniref:Rlp7 protein n=1 Tax=Saccharomycopsis crataegensis TaxID=43959 RepID=A0AAV5QQJ3_9ASCO|nr:Rlp7 protein [Saccharomycopsis crataegensis]
MSEPQKLNSNPEILLKKRKNADRIRLEKQEAARKRKEEQLRRSKEKKNRFLRVETLLAKKMSTSKEAKRITRVSKVEKDTNQRIKLISKSKTSIDDIEDSTIQTESWDEKPKLLLVVRVRSSNNSKIPSKANKVLQALRLTHSNLGTFIKLTPTVLPLLKIISPYIVIGSPDLITVRELMQKRATIVTEVDGKKKEVLLDDNSVIEDRLGEFGLICTEDLVHEIFSLGDNFKQVVNFLRPFQLAPPVSGWGPMARLKRIQLKEETDTTVSQRGNAPLVEIDINKHIANQN